jgi:hypothetical protein
MDFLGSNRDPCEETLMSKHLPLLSNVMLRNESMWSELVTAVRFGSRCFIFREILDLDWLSEVQLLKGSLCGVKTFHFVDGCCVGGQVKSDGMWAPPFRFCLLHCFLLADGCSTEEIKERGQP